MTSTILGRGSFYDLIACPECGLMSYDPFDARFSKNSWQCPCFEGTRYFCGDCRPAMSLEEAQTLLETKREAAGIGCHSLHDVTHYHRLRVLIAGTDGEKYCPECGKIYPIKE